MKLTCVTAVFNAIRAGNRERLIRCVESVAALKTEHEHLIYDGASTDGTVDLLRELEAKTPGLKVVSEPDTGIYNALNKGVRDAQGEWFYVLGCDDYIERPEKFDGLLACDAQDTDVFVVPVMYDENGVVHGETIVFRKNIFWSMPYCHQRVVMRTRDVRRFGGFDEQCPILGDYSLVVQCHLNALRICFTGEWFTVYYVGGASARAKGILDESQVICRKHFGLQEKHLAFFRKYYAFPLHKILPYVIHKDPTLRHASWYMIFRWLRGVAFMMVGR